jgi:predicted membrane protein
MDIPRLRGRVIVGLLLVILGAIAVMHNYGIIDLSEYPITWEYFFMAGGLLFILLSSNKVAGIIFFSIGLFNLVPELWPLILVMFGLYIIFGRRYCRSRFHHNRFYYHMPNAEINAEIKDAFMNGKYHWKNRFYERTGMPNGDKNNLNDYVESINVFGGGHKIINTDNFKGGSIVSIFGGAEIDLTNAKLAEGNNVIEITAVFGGSTIIVPPDWKVDVDVLAIFGGFGDKRTKYPNKTYEEGKLLTVKGFVLFGGGEVKTLF